MLELDFHNLHHAYLIDGQIPVGHEKVQQFLLANNVAVQGNPDVVVQTYETLGIDDARKLKVLQSNKPFGEKKFFIIQSNFLTIEAQNALLKVFEEPTGFTHFFLLSSNKSSLIPTLLSRMQVIVLERTAQLDARIDAEKFLAMDITKRLDLIKKITATKKDTEKLTRADGIVLLNQLEELLYQDSPNTPVSKRLSQGHIFGEIRMARAYLHDRGSSVKMLLEHIALIL